MRALLVYYMTKQLLIGAGERRRSSTASTPRCAYFTPIVGGVIADRWLGKRRAVIIGGSIMALGPFHDGVRAAVLSGAGDDRARQRPVPAEPAEPDRRSVPARTIRAAAGPTTSTTSASTSAASSRRWSAARSANSTAGTGASAPPASAWSLGLVIYVLGGNATCREQAPRASRSRRSARASTRTAMRRTLDAAARRRPGRHGLPRRLRADRQHRGAVGRRRRRSHTALRRDSDDLVPVANPLLRHPDDAAAARVLAPPRRGRARRDAADAEDGDRRADRGRGLSAARRGGLRTRTAAARAGSGWCCSSSCSPWASCTSCRPASACSRGWRRPGFGATTVAAWFLAIFSGSLAAGVVGTLWTAHGSRRLSLRLLAVIAAIAAVLLLALDRPARRIERARRSRRTRLARSIRRLHERHHAAHCADACSARRRSPRRRRDFDDRVESSAQGDRRARHGDRDRRERQGDARQGLRRARSSARRSRSMPTRSSRPARPARRSPSPALASSSTRARSAGTTRSSIACPDSRCTTRGSRAR